MYMSSACVHVYLSIIHVHEYCMCTCIFLLPGVHVHVCLCIQGFIERGDALGFPLLPEILRKYDVM